MTHIHQHSEVHTTVLTLDGMSCGACVRHVTRALEALTGVVHVEVNLQAHQANIEHLPTFVDALALTQAVRDAGYAAGVERTVSWTERARHATADSAAEWACGCCAPSPRVVAWTNLGTSTIG
jgi:copper chaperone CopZ